MGSAWQLVEAIKSGMPPWSIVPPLLFGVAAVITAWTNYRRSKQAIKTE